METWTKIQEILGDLLDMDTEEILANSYLLRELEAESIDLLEIAVSLNAAFKIQVEDDVVFLRRIRQHIREAKEEGANVGESLEKTYPFLGTDRIQSILNDLDAGPVLQVGDILRYVNWKQAV